MGDGQHAWAAVELIQLIRNMFVREENDRLIIGSGILPEWTRTGSHLSYGPTLTAFGRVTVHLEGASHDRLQVHLASKWHGRPPTIEVRVPGYQPVEITNPDDPVTLEPTKEDAP